MKNLIIIIVIAIVGFGGYYVFSDPKIETNTSGMIDTTNGYNGESDTIQPNATTTTTATTTSIIPATNKTKHMVTIETNLGTITFETYDNDAPNTVKNFVTLANKGFYNGVIFHRVIPGFMIQGGDPTGTGRGGPGYQFADELNPNTASYKAGYKKGVVAMANAGPDTNGSQFFIMTADYPLSHDYTIFGKVTSGQDVVDKIANVPRDTNDKPLSPVTMTKVITK